MDRLNCHRCIRYLLPYPINNLSYILIAILYYLILYWAFQIFSPDDVFSFTFNICLKVCKLTNMYVCIFVLYFSNTLIYRYIAIVYVYKYVWKQKKQINGKPVRKRIAFVTLPFFWFSIYHCALSFFLFQDILFARLIASLSGWFLFF